MDNVTRKEKIWFLSPPVNVPTGGINNFYRLCDLANELGIESYVLSVSPYSHPDPSYLSKYWRKVDDVGFRHDMFNTQLISEGDIIVQPEIYNWKPLFSVPVRRVTYIQNWALVSNHSFEKHYWVYNNMTHLTYCVDAVAKKEYPHDFRLIGGNMELEETRGFIESEKVKWSTVSPYFNKEDFTIGNKEIDILMFPRKSPKLAEMCKNYFGDRVILVDGVSPEEAKNMISRSKIIILPSAAEGLCFPAIEAILSGTIVATWNCGAPEDYIIDGYTGILSEYANMDQLIEKVEKIINDENEMKRINRNAYELITNSYNKENAKRELLISYFSALSTKPE